VDVLARAFAATKKVIYEEFESILQRPMAAQRVLLHVDIGVRLRPGQVT